MSDDYSNRLSDSGKGRSFRKLYEILNAINNKLKTLSKEKETRSQYLGSLIEQSGAGILSIDLNGKIHLVNKTFQNLLRLDKARPGMNLGDLSKELLDIEEIPGYQVMIKVEDNGPGMNKEIMDKIFIPFFSTKKGGSGIGLSLSRQIIMMHRGSIEVSSKEGVGSVFEVLL